MSGNDLRSSAYCKFLQMTFTDSFTVAGKISTDTACSHGPSAVAEHFGSCNCVSYIIHFIVLYEVPRV